MENQFDEVINDSFNTEIDLLIEDNEDEANSFHAVVRKLKEEIIRLQTKKETDERNIFARIQFLERQNQEQFLLIKQLEKVDSFTNRNRYRTPGQIKSLRESAIREKKRYQKLDHKEYKKNYWLNKKERLLNDKRRKNSNRKTKGESSKGKETIVEVEES